MLGFQEIWFYTVKLRSIQSILQSRHTVDDDKLHTSRPSYTVPGYYRTDITFTFSRWI